MGWDQGIHPMSPSITQMPIWDGIEVSPRRPQCHPDAHTGWDQGGTRCPQCHPEIHMEQDPDVPSVTQMPIWDGIEVSP